MVQKSDKHLKTRELYLKTRELYLKIRELYLKIRELILLKRKSQTERIKTVSKFTNK